MTSDPEAPVNSWSVILRLLQEIDRRYAEQFKAQAEALIAADKRYQERYIAQQEAVTAALIAQKEAVAAALLAQKEATSETAKAATKQFDAFSSSITTKLDDLTAARDNSTGGRNALGVTGGFLLNAAIAIGAVGVLLVSVLRGHP